MHDGFGVGLLYEDCAYHPVLCTGYSPQEADLQGISLIDGSSPRSCSIEHCGPVPLTLPQAVWIKQHFGKYVAGRTAGQEPDDIIG